MLRRAQSYEALDKLEDSLEGLTKIVVESNPHEGICIIKFTSDYKRVLELDPSQSAARQAVMVSGVYPFITARSRRGMYK